MIKLRTMIPIFTALTISTAAMQSCDIIRDTHENITAFIDKDTNSDTFVKEGKTDTKYTAEIFFGVLGFVSLICLLHYLKNPGEAKKHLFRPKKDNENIDIKKD